MTREWMKVVPNRWKSKEHYVKFQYKFSSELFSFYRKYMDFKNKKVLEIGCGMGGFSVFLALKGAKVVAVDSELYDEVLATAKRFAKQKGVKVDFRLADAASLEFSDGSFDAIVMNSVVEHLEKPLAVLLECKRVLKPGGMLFVNFPLFYGPLGGHIGDFIKIPWFHLFPSELVRRKLMNKKFKKGILSGKSVARVYDTLNHITLSKFKSYLRQVKLKVIAYKISPSMNSEGVKYLRSIQDGLRTKSPKKIFETIVDIKEFFGLTSFLAFLFYLIFIPLAYVSYINELFAGAVTMVIEKPAKRFKN